MDRAEAVGALRVVRTGVVVDEARGATEADHDGSVREYPAEGNAGSFTIWGCVDTRGRGRSTAQLLHEQRREQHHVDQRLERDELPRHDPRRRDGQRYDEGV